MSLKKDFAIIFHSAAISKHFCGQCRDCFDHTLGSEFSITVFCGTMNQSSAPVNLGCEC